MRLAEWLFAGLSVACFAACGGNPKPGFENLGGGDDGTTGVTGSTHATTAAQTSAVVTTTVGATTSASTTTGSGCVDTGPGEPNATETTAFDLGTIGDCDDQGDVVSGVLNGANDVDWYKFHGIDMSSLCSVDPARALSSSGSVRICKFIQCDASESNNFTCPSGSTPATSPIGRPGCCGSGDMDISLTCGSSQLNADDAMVYIRVDNPQSLPCASYTVAYHY
jgi:hypothetical protein